MTHMLARALHAAAFAAALMRCRRRPSAQDQPRSGGFLDNLFGGGQSRAAGARAARTRPSSRCRIDQLEAQIRQLTGTIEQLQYRNQQLEQQMRGAGRRAMPPQAAGAAGAAQRRRCRRSVPPPAASGAATACRRPAGAGTPRRRVRSRRMNPNAPGAPRPLGGGPGPASRRRRSASRRRSSWPSRRSACPADASPARRSIFRRSPGRRSPACRASRTADAHAAAAAVAQPERHRRGRPPSRRRRTCRRTITISPTAMCCARTTPRRGRVADFPEEISERPAGAGRAVLARREPVPAPALRRRGRAFLAISTKYEQPTPRRRTRCCGLAKSLAALKQKEMACATLGRGRTANIRAPRTP